MQGIMFHGGLNDDRDFDFWKSCNESAVQRVGEFMEERVREGVSPEMVSYVSVARYATLIEMSRATLRGMFSKEDFYLLLNANPYPWWKESSWCYSHTCLADALLGYDQDDPHVIALYKKISALDTVRLLALTDLLECGWRRGIDWIADATGAHSNSAT